MPILANARRGLANHRVSTFFATVSLFIAGALFLFPHAPYQYPPAPPPMVVAELWLTPQATVMPVTKSSGYGWSAFHVPLDVFKERADGRSYYVLYNEAWRTRHVRYISDMPGVDITYLLRSEEGEFVAGQIVPIQTFNGWITETLFDGNRRFTRTTVGSADLFEGIRIGHFIQDYGRWALLFMALGLFGLIYQGRDNYWSSHF